MKLARIAFWALGLLLAPAAVAKAPPCAEWGGVRVSRDLYFSESQGGVSQAALVDLQGRFGPSWLQAQFKDKSLRFENKMPGLGLPSTIYHVELTWLSPLGHVLATNSYPEEAVCASMSLFPGQVSPIYPVERPQEDQALRLRVRVWAVTP
jgi:hypothetical protein